ncbi:protein LURP-one-related 8-like [Miscanthus floridulus]|uniref:protein LURP-one-related 8-like n=1 Tax=Miscanthus floridulus TaxID=154761 RepID=UPI00345A902A
MARARPNAIAPEPPAAAGAAAAATMTTTSTSRGDDAGGHQQQDQERPPVLTVWRKSLLLNCSGFTVYDASGALAFRVDCYDSARRGLRRRAAEVVLMDVAGTPLLTVRRRSRLTSLGLAPDRWLIFDGDAAAGAGCCRPNKAKPFMSVRRARLGIGLGLLGASSGKAPLAYVTPLQAQAGEAYVVEGSYGARACAVRDARGDAVAEVRRKERVGDDVFRLVAGPRLGAPLAMALVIALDEMFAAGAGSGSGSARRPSLLRRTWSARCRG